MLWLSRSKYVDIETGELIPEDNLHGYIIVRKKRNVIIFKKAINGKRTKEQGQIEWINECRKRDRKQGKLF